MSLCLPLNRALNATTLEATTHTASTSPTRAANLKLGIIAAQASPRIMATSIAQRNRPNKRPKLSCFQRDMIPKPSSNANGAVKGIKTLLKYGGPTEILPSPRASSTSGYKVPSRILAAATTRITLFKSRAVSRENNSNLPVLRICGARQAYKDNEPPTTMPRKIRINTPRSGSVAKACTEVNTPERTRNVPNKLNENAKMASNTVQALKALRFSVTASECINAVPTSHGIKEAFSTGSQNHQPPQPSS